MPWRRSFKYDVFLSFRGKDTRTGVTGYLYYFLEERGFRTFLDERELQKGEGITPALSEAIGESRIFIIVFSDNYASSSFCLDELVQILDECIKGKGRIVLPVFYHVEPCTLRHLKGSYGRHLAKHEERFQGNKENLDKLKKWKEALKKAADIVGWHFKRDGNEIECIKTTSIVKEVSRHVARPPVGLKSRLQRVNEVLSVGSDDEIHMVGICGIDGIGKTTVAWAVCNFNASKFDVICFLDNVRENSVKHGLMHLQEMLLSETVGHKDIKLASVEKGTSKIKEILNKKKVLLILDDVDKLEQLLALAGQTDWFGSGSRVIITTHDEHLLARHGVVRIYKVDRLNKTEALTLLNWKAFDTDKFDLCYMDVLNRAVTCASGLPLTLEVIGSHLCGKIVEECEAALDQYERVPIRETQKILKASFDALPEYQQEICSYIVRDFKEYELTEVQDRLRELYGVCRKNDIRVLLDKSLIKINEHGQVTSHYLIQDMVRETVQQKSREDPGECSSLRLFEDIDEVLEENT